MENLQGYTPLYDVNLTPNVYKKIARALRTIHACGVRHGDLHFGNILVKMANKQVSIKIIDFGESDWCDPRKRQTGNISWLRAVLIKGLTNAARQKNTRVWDGFLYGGNSFFTRKEKADLAASIARNVGWESTRKRKRT